MEEDSSFESEEDFFLSFLESFCFLALGSSVSDILYWEVNDVWMMSRLEGR